MSRSIHGRIALLLIMLAFIPISGTERISAEAPQSVSLCTGFLPPNNLNIPVGMFGAMGISQVRFNWVMDKLEAIYTPIVAKGGGTLKVNRLWTDGTVNASAERIGKKWIINMYGGMARHPLLSEEGFAMVACHETGHHIGMEPRYPRDWATDEGQADYFSTLKCLRRFYEGEDNETWARTANVDPFAVQRCASQFQKRSDELICMRAASGAQSIADVFQDLDGTSTKAAFDTPDTKVVTTTSHQHPDTQCRLDTLFNAATCPVDKSVELDNKDWKVGTCVEGVDSMGWRPRCWFSPN